MRWMGYRTGLLGEMVERVPWDTPAYGFVIVVPKSNGKFRVTINPTGVNKATKRVDPEGGYMPASMVQEAMRVGRQKFAAQLDMSDAFMTLKLGPTAQRLSTFTSPLGKLRWKHGWFGWHSFPATFQRVIMEKVVLPTLDVVPEATILAWIDDIVNAAEDFATFLRSLLEVIDRIIAIGGRLNLEKCNFLPDIKEWSAWSWISRRSSGISQGAGCRLSSTHRCPQTWRDCDTPWASSDITSSE